MNHVTGTFATPLGALSATRDERGRLHGLRFVDPPPEQQLVGEQSAGELARELEPVRDQVREYFAGGRAVFELELAPRGTPFQRAVWRALEDLPFGATVSYAELARVVGRPGAARAVGAAARANPWALVVPCHRLVAVGGALAGYAWGLERKRALLALERGSRQGAPGAAVARTLRAR